MIIGICSFSPQVGKTTCAKYLRDSHNFEYVEMSDQIIRFSTKYLGYNGNKSDPKQRKILQDVGKLWKDIYPDIWLYHNLAGKFEASLKRNYDPTFYQYKTYKEGFLKLGVSCYFYNGIVVSGIRSSAEANAIKELGGRVYLVDRDIEVVGEKHPVESELYGYQNFDGLLANIDDIVNFYKIIEKLLFKKQESAIHVKDCPYSGITIPSYKKFSAPVEKAIKKFNIGFSKK